MVRCILSQLKPSELYILSCGKDHGPSASAFPTAKNVEPLGLHPIDHGIYPHMNGWKENLCSSEIWVSEPARELRGDRQTVLALLLSLPIIFVFFPIFYYHIKSRCFYMEEIKRDTNQQHF